MKKLMVLAHIKHLYMLYDVMSWEFQYFTVIYQYNVYLYGD